MRLCSACGDRDRIPVAVVKAEGGEHVGKIGMALGGVIIISAAAALVGFLTT